MEEKEDVKALGQSADGSTGAGRIITVCHAVLPAPHNEHQPADPIVQPATLRVPACCDQRAIHALVAPVSSHVCAVYDWQSLPALCRGYDHCGTMFAA